MLDIDHMALFVLCLLFSLGEVLFTFMIKHTQSCLLFTSKVGTCGNGVDGCRALFGYFTSAM